MGIRFFENFNFPYMAVSPKAFWKRWHISLSNWIKDYRLPATNRKKVHYDRQQAISEISNTNSFKGYAALFLTWALMGFWHGANWTFIIWGLYHAFLVTFHRVISKYTGRINKKIFEYFRFLHFIAIFNVGLDTFPGYQFSNRKGLFLKLFNPSKYTWLGMRENIYVITFLVMLFIIIAYFIDRYIIPALENTYIGQFANAVVMTFVIALVIVFLRPISQFIYFQF